MTTFNSRSALLVLAVLSASTVQTVAAQTTSFAQIQHIHTAMDHLTVLEIGEPVTTLAIANPDAFTSEQHGDKIFLKPVSKGESTNLLIWTGTRQLSFELEPAGEPASMDVLVRCLPERPMPRASADQGAEAAAARTAAAVTARQALVGAQDIIRDEGKLPQDQVGVQIEQIYRVADLTLLRYTVINRRAEAVRVAPPTIQLLSPSQQPVSLIGLRNHQLKASSLKPFRVQPQAPLVEAAAAEPAHDLAPGAAFTGVITFKKPEQPTPQIYSLRFGSAADAPAAAAVL